MMVKQIQQVYTEYLKRRTTEKEIPSQVVEKQKKKKKQKTEY